jgi:dTDP-4-dehydrorhamnose reductase
MRILVTGGSGYIGGSAVQHFWPGRHPRCTALGFTYHNASLDPIFTSDPRVTPYQVDLGCGGTASETEFAAWVRSFAPDYIFHMAAVTNSNCSLAEALPVNAGGTERVARAALGCAVVPVVVHMSSDWVYDGCDAMVEEDSHPATKLHGYAAYGQSKLAAERVYFERTPELLPRTVILRSALLLGPPLAYFQKGTFFLWMYGQMERAAAGTAEPVGLFADEFRTPVYIGDVLGLFDILTVPQSAAPLLGQTYNLAGPDRMSRYELGVLAAEVGGLNPSQTIKAVRLAEVGLEGKRPQDLSMSCAKLSGACPEWSAKRTSMRAAIEATLAQWHH